MNAYQSIAQLRKELRGYARRLVSTVVKAGAYSLSTADGLGDKIRGYETQDSEEESYDYDGARIFPFGIRSRPPKGVLGLWVAVTGGNSNGAIIGAESSRFGPSDLEDGEVGFYNKVTGCTIKLDKNGTIAINAPSGQTVQVNGSDFSLLKTETLLSDLSTLMGFLATWVPLVVTAVATAPSGTAADPGVASQAGTIKSAIAAGTYKSTKAKNG